LSSPLTDEDYSGSINLLLQNVGVEEIQLVACKSYVQLIPLPYFTGPVIGARDSFFRVKREDGCFGSTEGRQFLEEILAQRLADEEVCRVIENGDL
jgi:dUTPase